MNRSETALVLAKCAAYDQRTIGEGDVEAWHDIIGGYTLPDALAAVIDWYRDHRDRVMPSDIRSRIVAARTARVNAVAEEDLMADYGMLTDPHEARRYLTDRTARVKLIADGATLPQALAAHPRAIEATR